MTRIKRHEYFSCCFFKYIPFPEEKGLCSLTAQLQATHIGPSFIGEAQAILWHEETIPTALSECYFMAVLSTVTFPRKL